MKAKKKVDDSKYLDPVFSEYGMKVYTNEYAQMIRKDNLEKKSNGKKITNLIPQEGFQETVYLADADVLIIGGKKGGGKCLSINTPVVTPFGYREIGDLKIGDIITNPVDGGMQRVINIYDHENIDLYEVTFEDGSTCKCCDDHLWEVRQTGYTKKKRMLYGGDVKDDYRVWTFRMIRKWLDDQANGAHYMNGKKGSSKEYLVTPLCEPVKFTKSGNCMHRPDIDPYIIGAIIGDGNISSGTSVSFFSRDKEIVGYFEDGGLDMSHFSVREDGLVTYRIPQTQIRPALTTLRLSNERSEDMFIPTAYKWGRIEDRWAILQGLMDTDGYIDSRGHCSYTSVSKKLAEDVQFVVRSLGGTAKITVDDNSGYRAEDGKFIKCQTAYTVWIRIKESQRLFRLTRKQDRCKAFNGGVSEIARRIISYRYAGKEDARCITVDSPRGLYMINDFIVTHNTWISLFKALDYIFNPDVIMRGFRKYEDDIERGIWSASKQVFKGFGTPVRSSYEWQFLGGRGASMRMEHLQDLGKISDRFRGSELAYIDIEELAEHTKDNVNVIFDFLSVNRNTAGVKSQLVATCNPVGKSNKLRLLLDWYIDPETDTIIPERDGKVRYMFNYGSDISEIAWGNTWKEVYDNPAAKAKIDALCEGKNLKPQDLILTLQFIEGDYADNKILQSTDSRYVSRLAAKGGESVVNDLSGVWRDIDSGTSLVSVGDMENFFAASEHSSSDDVMRASADVAIVGDFLVMWAARGHHIVDVEGLVGMSSDSVIPAIEQFLKKNGVHKENFTFDENGLGIWLRESSAFARSRGFNNKSAPSDTRLYNNLKSECADKFIDEIHRGVWSIDERLKYKKFRDTKGNVFTLYDRMMSERLALKRKDDTPRWEIISKQQMKAEIGHSPDFIEGLFMMEQIFLQPKKEIVRRGFGAW